MLGLEYLAQHTIKVSQGDHFFEFTEPDNCSNCGKPLAADWSTLYANAYPRGQEETQWFSRVCGDCEDAVAEDLHLDSAQRR